MASSESKSEKEDSSGKASTTATPNSASSSFREQLHQSVTQAVQQTNHFLSICQKFEQENIERPYHQIQQHYLQPMIQQCQTLYHKRHEYGRQLVAGNALLGGAYFGLRRGKIAGVLGATLCGGITYFAIYEPIAVYDRWPEWKETTDK